MTELIRIDIPHYPNPKGNIKTDAPKFQKGRTYIH